MRIALFHDLPAGGALRFVQEVTKRSSAEHTYVLFTLGAPQHTGDSRSGSLEHSVDEIRHVAAPSFGTGSAARIAAFLAAQPRVAAAIDAAACDVALVHPSQLTQAPPMLTKLRRTPSLYYTHEVRRRSFERGYQPFVDRSSKARVILRRPARAVANRCIGYEDRRAVAAATTITTNSCFSVESIARSYQRDAHLVYPGVDLEMFRPGGARGQRLTVLSVGALDPTKGHELAVDAIAMLPPGVRPQLRIVHERVDPEFARRLTVQASVQRVDLEILSGLSDEELAQEYACASATVALARLEPFGLTPLESVASGTPVLAVRQGGYRETLRPGLNAVLVDRDVESVARGLEQVLALAAGRSPAQIRATIGAAWDWDHTTTRLHEL